MNIYADEMVQDGLRKAGPNGLRAVSGTRSWPVRKLWKGGFSLNADARIRGFVEIYDGDTYLFSCLACAMELDGGEQAYQIKRQTPYLTAAPVDFERDGDVPTGVLAAFEATRIGL